MFYPKLTFDSVVSDSNMSHVVVSLVLSMGGVTLLLVFLINSGINHRDSAMLWSTLSSKVGRMLLRKSFHLVTDRLSSHLYHRGMSLSRAVPSILTVLD